MVAWYSPYPEVMGNIYTRFGGFVTGAVDRFNRKFFNVSPRQAASMNWFEAD